MRKFALLGASALVLALGVASASAQPSGQNFLTRGDFGDMQSNPSPQWGPQTTAGLNEGRAAAIDNDYVYAPMPQPYFLAPEPDYSVYDPQIQR